MSTRIVRRGSAAVRPVVALAVFGTLLAGCAPAERAVAPDLRPGGPRLDVSAAALPAVRISEFHYDNAGTDAGEQIEISGPANTSLAGWKVYLYNGNGGASYTPTTTLSGTIPATCGARGVVVIPAAGLQNGDPDGIALVDASNNVVEFLSYGGTFTAVGGPASGMTSTDVGIKESSATPLGHSLQRTGAGTWEAKANTFGACNDASEVPPAVVASVTVAPAPAQVTVGGTVPLTATARDASAQTIAGVAFTWTTSDATIATVSSAGVVTGVAAGQATITATAPNGVAGTSVVTVVVPSGSASNVRVSEFHYDNDGTDSGEAIEIEGDAGGSLAGWSLVLYSGTPGSSSLGQPYSTITLTSTIPTTCGARGVVVQTLAVNGLQNGDADGIALVNATGQVVEFLSYEGTFTATGGPAAGMTSTDVGVSEPSSTAAGRSLQRAGNGTWFGPYTATFGSCNAAVPPPPQTGISFSGRVPSDPALPVGYQDQLFATLRDENTGVTVPTTFTWVSETPAIASVDQRGVITALAAGSAVIRATAANGVTNTTTLPTEVAPLANPALYRNALTFGTPTDGTPGDELRVSRPQYELSYNRARGTPNWVAYHLSKATRGDLPGYRCDCFATDPAVTGAGEVGLTTADYTGSGFDRGHMVRSNDRELARGDQATTYYLSNIVPQYANQNQGRWADLESYLQTVADGPALPEVYIFAGARGEAGRIAGGRIAVPTHTWKVAVVLPAGMTPAQVDEASDILDLIAVDMPNLSNLPRDGNWQAHRTTVDAIEAAAGYDVLSALPNLLEGIIESGDRKPTAVITGAGLAGGLVAQPLTFSGATSTDPDIGGTLDDALSYLWAVDGAVTGIGAQLTTTFTTPGTHTVRLIVADRFGFADTTSANVTILSAVQGVGVLADLVQELGANASLPRAEANSLAAKLRASAQLLANHADRPAGIAVLEAFIHEIEAMAQSDRLDDAKAARLIDYARLIIRSAGG